MIRVGRMEAQKLQYMAVFGTTVPAHIFQYYCYICVTCTLLPLYVLLPSSIVVVTAMRLACTVSPCIPHTLQNIVRVTNVHFTCKDAVSKDCSLGVWRLLEW